LTEYEINGIINTVKNIGYLETGVNRYTIQISHVGFAGSIYVPELRFY